MEMKWTVNRVIFTFKTYSSGKKDPLGDSIHVLFFDNNFEKCRKWENGKGITKIPTERVVTV
jgi:hypothetical protein|tara:strand:+ start:404 stop:589 length:186 start_codon:yes stop_codon:yes gene_type:complete